MNVLEKCFKRAIKEKVKLPENHINKEKNLLYI